MGSPAYQEYLKSPEWAATRRWALERAEHRCQVCNSDGPLDVHHRTYERLGHEWPSDLTVLCRDCHGLYHGRLPDKPRRIARPTLVRRPMGPEAAELAERVQDLQRQIEQATEYEEKLKMLAEKARLASELRALWADNRALSPTGTEG